MKKEVAEKWVADLRTNPPQTQRALFDGKGYCCLGRLCVVLGREFREVAGDAYMCEEEACILPESVKEEAGMVSYTGALQNYSHITDADYEELTAMNDSGAPFSYIADYIEKNWERL